MIGVSRRTVLGGLAALSAPRIARARDPFRIFQITYRGETDVERGFRDYLEQRGIDVEITHRSAELDPSRVPDILKEVREAKPDLVYTWGTPVTLATFGKDDDPDPARYITDIPGVFTMVSTPVKAGVVPSRASSGRNITGTSHVVPAAPQLRAMDAYRPFKRLGVLYTPTEQNSNAIVADLRSIEGEMGFTLLERTFALGADGKPDASTAPALVAELAAEGAEWLYYLPDTFLSQNIEQVAPAATALGLPGFSAVELLQRSALISLVCRYYSLGQLTAYKAEQILVTGTAPAEIPIETLERFALIINMPLAREMELYPPLGMLSYANVLT
ncbi:ABC transporter substrate-binding protein [Acuticoccus sp. MNP-M23]|uniref:ABC transporter substrate-binding protein n=1 Tax=Acuticoccus sp. MNP-M23 TaxID=3072793 RepID=UPI002815B614|nr:ABC transporter substrate-binding protein [Acuticoccus sp. MNP-M23]WMS42982.1 ABC transporter substrate-binding protein [Acuticoccus sp. MNP-M23]